MIVERLVAQRLAVIPAPRPQARDGQASEQRLGAEEDVEREEDVGVPADGLGRVVEAVVVLEVLSYDVAQRDVVLVHCGPGDLSLLSGGHCPLLSERSLLTGRHLDLIARHALGRHRILSPQS